MYYTGYIFGAATYTDPKMTTPKPVFWRRQARGAAMPKRTSDYQRRQKALFVQYYQEARDAFLEHRLIAKAMNRPGGTLTNQIRREHWIPDELELSAMHRIAMQARLLTDDLDALAKELEKLRDNAPED